MNGGTIEPLGDNALLIRLGEHIDAAINERALALAASLRVAALPGVHDIAPAYASVCVRFDPRAWTGAGGRSPFENLAVRIRPLVDAAATAPALRATAAAIEIPVCYGGEFGPDLEALAGHAHLDAAAVIARHSGAEYRVAMLGFMPGFPYLLGLPAELHMPRRASPRTGVPAGSVAIGGAQTGIYPRALPGGWQLIGRTPLDLFDPSRAIPALLEPGQRVRFCAIDAAEFAAHAR
jgi:KipI family sensor histidine kinase inhibitor